MYIERKKNMPHMNSLQTYVGYMKGNPIVSIEVLQIIDLQL